MSEENSRIRDPKNINQIFKILRKEYIRIKGRPEDIMNGSFWVYMIPVSLPDTTPTAAQAFETILNGLISREHAPKDPPVADVIELVVDCGDMTNHSYIVAAIKEDKNKNKCIAGPLYVFLEVAKSGYDGTGPIIREEIQGIIDSKIPTITQEVYNVDDTGDFARLFKERGPIVQFSIPEFDVYTGGVDYDRRFIDS